MIVGWNHTSFTVEDIHKSVLFWSKHLGFEGSVSPRHGQWQEGVTGVRDASLLVAHLYGHGHHIEFIQYLAGAIQGEAPSPATVGAAHVCLEVDDIDRTWHELLAAGATSQGQVTEIDTGPVQGCKAAYIRDPNGIIIELLQMRSS
ncbi:MAG TPA: VOC family protein [Aestuariivirgaceae bacterium]|jgi:catechol 2,3-dioxygenase-like lactoylglutathione lyase family enzyme